jgi:hypothetical protein
MHSEFTIAALFFMMVFVLNTAPCGAQGALQSSAATGNMSNSNMSSNIAVAPWSDFTRPNGTSAMRGPNLAGVTSSAPFQGTVFAPGNLALATQRGYALPPTRLTSFVKESGHADGIYGDEGESDHPPLDNFDAIESGINKRSVYGIDLSTGHHSDLPAAWQYPQ